MNILQQIYKSGEERIFTVVGPEAQFSTVCDLGYDAEQKCYIFTRFEGDCFYDVMIDESEIELAYEDNKIIYIRRE